MTTNAILQRICFPDPALPSPPDLYMRGADPHAMRAGDTVQFDTYMNLFNAANWMHHCNLDGLCLRLCGSGTVIVRVWLNGETCVQTTAVMLSKIGACLDFGPPLGGVITFDLTAKTATQFTGGQFETYTTTEPIALAAVITTFQRDAAVTATAARITTHLDSASDLDGMHLFVVDNGQSVTLPTHPRLTLIPNKNLGGAGGFARGLDAAEKRGGFSHVVFMDDDATFGMESLHRTCAFLRLARDPHTALAGAMLSGTRPWQLWENGAVFDRVCKPQFSETDLRDARAVIAMEHATPVKPAGFYGGWWYFAFPLDGLMHYPFPFFVRGDDVSFSLSNKFAMATLNGVMSFQDDFAAKASPQTVYLDMRYHLHVHLVQAGHDIGRWRSLGVAMRLIGWSLMRMHYDSAAAQLMAWCDIINGPQVFTNDMTMANKRAAIGALIQAERWGPTTDTAPPPSRTGSPPRLSDMVHKATLNGHLLPGFGLVGRHAHVPVTQRGKLWATAWAAQASYTNADCTATYTVRHSKWMFARRTGTALWLSLRWLVGYTRIKAAHRTAFAPLTNRFFWQRAFKG